MDDKQISINNSNAILLNDIDNIIIAIDNMNANKYFVACPSALDNTEIFEEAYNIYYDGRKENKVGLGRVEIGHRQKIFGEAERKGRSSGK